MCPGVGSVWVDHMGNREGDNGRGTAEEGQFMFSWEQSAVVIEMGPEW